MQAPAAIGPSGRDRRRRRLTVGRVAFAGTLGILAVVFIAPLIWMLSTSLKTWGDATRTPLSWLPHPFSLHGYRPIVTLSAQTPVIRWFINSLVAATVHSALVLATASTAAYALARMEFRGKRVIFAVIIGTLFLPSFVLLIPNYLIVSKLGWLDSLWAIIFPGVGGAFGVFFLRQFFQALPRDLEEAAILDGANHWQVFLRIVLPLSRPGLATLTVLSFLTNWNDFVWPVYVLFNPSHFTLPAGLSILQGAYTTDYPVIMGGAVIASIPVLILFIVAQRHIIESVARTGVKG